MGEVKKGVYQYKLTSSDSGWTAKPFGEMADGLAECTGATAEEVEKAMYDACKEASGTEKEFTFANDMVSPKVSLFTAAIEAAYEPK
mmetsp:Transcript_33766/g.112695  ORF Transcript_33766/g.112695 Transcript_33766/m.112695 type:complete len:87 (+) Transcript_33766:36-296(+)